MAATPEPITEHDSPPPVDPPSPASNDAVVSGLKPISRFSSDGRIGRTIPETSAVATISYCSVFVRDFLQRDYNFCSTKFSVASVRRGGKIRALDECFRNAEQWYSSAIDRISAINRRPFEIAFDEQMVEITHPLSGRLVRLLNQHDRLFAYTLFAIRARTLQSGQRDTLMTSAGKLIGQIHALAMPDNDRFAPDGTLLPE
jgi:hypothetical protein